MSLGERLKFEGRLLSAMLTFEIRLSKFADDFKVKFRAETLLITTSWSVVVEVENSTHFWTEINIKTVPRVRKIFLCSLRTRIPTVLFVLKHAA